MKRLLVALAVLALSCTLAGCGGLSKDDQALCDKVNGIEVYMDALGDPGDPESATSVFTALEGADNEKLAQVGRDYIDAHATDPTAYQERAKKICTE